MKIDKLGWNIIASMSFDEIEDDVNGILAIIIYVILGALLISIFAFIIFTRSIVNRINEILDDMEKVKQGDFSVICNIKSEDEISRLGIGFNTMLEAIANLISSIKEVSKELGMSSQNLAANSEETSASAEQVNVAVEEIVRGAIEQAADSEKGSQLMYALSEKLKHLLNNTIEIEDVTNEITEANDKGVKVVEELQVKTKSNEGAIEKIEHAIIELSNNTENIGSILDTINSISEQTNLLALNVSIQQQSVAVEEVANAADKLNGLADELNTELGKFKVE